MNPNTKGAVSAARSKPLTGDVYLLNTGTDEQPAEEADELREWRNSKRDVEVAFDPFDTIPWWPRAIAVALALVLASLAFHPEIAALLLSFKK